MSKKQIIRKYSLIKNNVINFLYLNYFSDDIVSITIINKH